MTDHFRGFKFDKKWRKHHKRDNVNKKGKSRDTLKLFRESASVRYRRRQLEGLGLRATSVDVSYALDCLHHPLLNDPKLEERAGNTTIGALILALEELEKDTTVPETTRRDSSRWQKAKSKDKTRKLARKGKEQLRTGLVA